MIRALPWDSDFFGFPVGSVEGSADAHELQGFECVYWLADVGDESPAALGFKQVDERITLECRAGSRQHPELLLEKLRALTRPGSTADLRTLRETVRASHTDSRFFQDERFPRERCEELYECWLERDFQSAACWTAERDGEPAGYITLAVNGDSTAIGLLGVVERHRGRGLAKALISQAILHSFTHGLPCRVVTQGRNAAALKAYTSMGFAVVRRQAWWHRWRNDLL